MALTEQTIIKSVEILPATKAANVCWANQIFRDEEMISETYHRKAYTEESAAEFLAEVGGAQDYIAALGWSV